MSVSDEQDRIETGRVSRFLKMAGLATSLLADKALGRAADGTISPQAAQRIADALGQLKGPLLKMGQAMSYMTEFLPPEVTAILAKMQNNVPAMGYFFVAKQIEADLGGPVERFFSSFERKAFAAASLGQVHRAVLKDGTPVAVKVQYPDMDRLVDSDLKTARMLIEGLRLSAGRKYDVSDMFDEARIRVLEELDYRREADNTDEFAAHFADYDGVRVPKVYREASGARVLTLEMMPGKTLGQAIQDGMSQEDRNHYGLLLIRMFWEEYFGLAMLHADPHPGNYLLHEGSIHLLDFGSVKRISPEWQTASRLLLRGMLTDDDAMQLAGNEMAGYLQPGDSPEKVELVRQIWQMLFAPYRHDTFDFGVEGRIGASMQVMHDYAHQVGIRMPPDAIFVHRAAGGILATLFQMKSEGRFQDLILPWVDESPQP
ncbi:MAG: AarF/ABC1/UbiB kinase family protein [Candidatus Sericytochromatia bacterium]|nr:AarF/ABC1/UbiB kinase family protein [Candidatus Sericytochromatia bacterium]